MKVRITVEDTLFSKLIRERANHYCECCGKYCGPQHEYGKLDCSHFFGRRHRSTRWEPLNAAAHCFTCHTDLGNNPPAHTAWQREYLGEEKYGILLELHQRILKPKKYQIIEMRKHFRDELKRMETLRNQGETQRIEFAGYF